MIYITSVGALIAAVTIIVQPDPFGKKSNHVEKVFFIGGLGIFFGGIGVHLFLEQMSRNYLEKSVNRYNQDQVGPRIGLVWEKPL